MKIISLTYKLLKIVKADKMLVAVFFVYFLKNYMLNIGY